MANRPFDQVWKRLEQEMGAGVFSEDLLRGLPAVAQRYLRHAIAPGTPLAASLRFTMHGSIKVGPWLRFSAREVIAPRRGFVWKARVAWGLLSAEDHYLDGEGATIVSLFGLVTLLNAGGPDVSMSARGRLLGESVFVPSAFLAADVAWEGVDTNKVRAAVALDGEECSTTLTVDDSGCLREVVVPRWGNQTPDRMYSVIPFGVAMNAEGSFSGFTIPCDFTASWWHGTDRRQEFFRARIEPKEFR